MLTLDRAKELLSTTTTQEHLFLHAKNVMVAIDWWIPMMPSDCCSIAFSRMFTHFQIKKGL